MNHFFLDTNVLLDFITDRKPFSDSAALLFQQSLDRKSSLYAASLSFSNIYYIVRQQQSHQKTIDLLLALEKLVTVVAIDSIIVQQALQSKFRDFEDALQFFAAASVPAIDAIITRNEKDFKESTLPVLSPDMALGLSRE